MTDIQHKTFLFDATRCIDCRACMVACSVENKIAMNKTRIWVAGVGLKGEYPNPVRVLHGLSLHALQRTGLPVSLPGWRIHQAYGWTGGL